MRCIDNVRALLEGRASAGNALEHELTEIVREVQAHGRCVRDFVMMNNAYFRQFPEFTEDWHGAMALFCSEFGLHLEVTALGESLEFRRIPA